MQIPLVEKFLFCISLETGGQILGWFSGIGAIVGLLVSVFLFGFAAINYEQLLNATISDNKEMLQLLDKAQYFVVLVLFLMVVYSAFSLYASVQLIRSVKNRSSRQAKPFVIILGLETIMAFLTILHFTWSAALQAVAGLIVNGYLFICVHSLWEMFRDEAMRGHSRHYRPYQRGLSIEKV